jgi:GNAT superfamily N-acetyltransferase
MPEPALRAVRLDDTAALPLLEGLTEEYTLRYGPNSEMRRAAAADFEPPQGLFVILEWEGQAVAGGGFRRRDAEQAEIKRMWTAPGWRRQGLARRVLQVLEEGARRAGYRMLVLETGLAQPEAVALYDRAGYARIPGYGYYKDSPLAVSFGKRLV